MHILKWVIRYFFATVALLFSYQAEAQTVNPEWAAAQQRWFCNGGSNAMINGKPVSSDFLVYVSEDNLTIEAVATSKLEKNEKWHLNIVARDPNGFSAVFENDYTAVLLQMGSGNTSRLRLVFIDPEKYDARSGPCRAFDAQGKPVR